MIDKKLKFNLYRLKSILIQYKYNKNNIKKEKDNDIIMLMNKYVDKLKEIDLIYTMADIESIKYSGTSYPDTLLINEIINRYNFYSIIIGYIEGNIDNLKKLINMDCMFLEDTDLIKNKLLEYKLFREKINEDLKKFKYNGDYKILVDIIATTPSYKNFIECFLDIKNSKYYNIETLEIIISYTIGYKNFDKFNFFDVHSEYLRLVNELNEYKNKNREKFNLIKKRKSK